MPTYEYTCEACGKNFEKFQSITAAPIKKCPHCGANRARRLISGGAGLLFKGSGFYITDYRSESYKSAAKSETSGTTAAPKTEPGKSNTPASTASETKPAPKAKPAKTDGK